jgi:succinyl-CoA synthetase beta subunit
MSFTLSEHESKELLRGAGIAVPDDRLVETSEAAVRAATELGCPVARWLCAADRAQDRAGL